MKLHRLHAFTWLAVGALSTASAATLQFTITNLAPEGSISILPNFLPVSSQNVTNVSVVTAGGGMSEILPQLTFLSGLGGVGEMFPFAGGGIAFPELLPGDALSFSLEDVDLGAETLFQFGGTLFGQESLTDGGGNFVGADFTVTAGDIAEFDNSGMTPLLILPNSATLGPESIAPSTVVLGFTVVPEPSAMLLSAAGFLLCMRRRRGA